MKQIKELENQIIEEMKCKTFSKMDLILIEALKNKGYEFKHPAEFRGFMMKNCHGENDGEKTTFFINNKPFLLLYKENLSDLNFSFSEGKTIAEYNLPKYKFL